MTESACEGCGTATAAIVTGLAFLPFVRSKLCGRCSAEQEASERESVRVKRADMLIGRAGAPKTRSWSLATYPDDDEGRQAKRAVIHWLEQIVRHTEESRDPWVTGPNLLLYGPVGSGKTGLAWGLVRALCEESVEARLVNFRDYLWGVKQSFRDDVPQDDRPHTVPLLALDDLGAERPTDFAREELASLVERRAMRGRPTIVTSNYEPAHLIQRLGHDDPVIGERIVSRLVEGAVQVRVIGGDRRLAA